ncbi:MAG: hypothetical protein K6F53_03315 [Lachnospiraceae bacterium]|nr:hypothetical protein [Lachnospiraceae bacterium]
MIIHGLVEEKAEIVDNKVCYTVLTGPGNRERIRVVSEGKQALKDALFLRKDQKITVCGRRTGDGMSAHRSRIDIKNLLSD